ncbi:MAG: molybdopterin-synthase adenylyltransferase MoeB [Alphaproteobacteria bacterium]|nr:molybdopterin-synthase adenylyltransferase MoeB [Alphaproteobacteria bacterium]
MRELTEAEFHRYARHLILDEVGEEGQARLLDARVVVIGAGGLGAPVSMYLAAAGVGTLVLVDDDTVDLTNLQRQIVHATDAVGRPKVASAIDTLARINPGVRIEAVESRLDAGNAARIIAGASAVVDGSDNFATRYVLNAACRAAAVPLIAGALSRFEGQLTTILPDASAPCYRCLFPEAPDPALTPSCEEAGILGAVAGVIGTLQATETLKLLLGLGEPLAGRLLLYDALGPGFQEIRYGKRQGCPDCG